MRFRKTIGLGKLVKINLSKSGVSATVGMKGLSVNVGKNGAYLNTGIPGTGLYDRTKIGGNMNTIEQAKQETETIDNEFKPPYKTFGAFLSFLCFIIGLPSMLVGLILILAIFINADGSAPEGLMKTAAPMAGIGLVLFMLHIINHRKAKKNHKAEYEHKKKIEQARAEQRAKDEEAYRQNQQKQREAKQKILDARINAINAHDLFDGCKIFTIDYNNIIAFSENGYMAICTEKESDLPKIFGIDHITKIVQEIKNGNCYAHIYTDDFENNVFDLFIGTAESSDDQDNIRKLYSEIKNLYTILKNKDKK